MTGDGIPLRVLVREMVRLTFVDGWPRVAAVLSVTLLGHLAGVIAAVALALVTDGVVSGRMSAVAWGAVLGAVVLVVSETGEWAGRSLRMSMIERMEATVNAEVVTAACGAATLDPLEDPEFADQVELLRRDSIALACVPDAVAKNVGAALQLVTAIVVLATAHVAANLAVVGAIPYVVLSRRAAHREAKSEEHLSSSSRAALASVVLTASPSSAREFRAFDVADHVARKVAHDLELVRRRQQRAAAPVLAMRLGAGLCFGAGVAGAFLLTGRAAVNGAISPAEMVLVVVLTARVNANVTAVARALERLAWAGRGVRRLLWVRSYAAEHRWPGTASPPARLDSGMEVRDLSFAYPSRPDEPVVKGITAELPAGSVVAVVGPNGAGKSTFVNLLLALYRASGGTIVVDDVPIESLDVDELRMAETAQFQDFLRPAMTLYDAVRIGDIDRAGRAAVESALADAGAGELLATLSGNLDTELGREGEHDLSSGQWTKVAHARSLVRTQPLLVVVDEPTAHLDPFAEAELFDTQSRRSRHHADARGTITLLVTHRFNSAVRADLILVVDDGRIVERGTHSELMAAERWYHHQFTLQASTYK